MDAKGETRRASAVTVEKPELEAMEIAHAGGPEVDAYIESMEQELAAAGGLETGFFHLQFKDPRHFTWFVVAFASMGGLLSGLDQSLISGANLYLPKDLHLDDRQVSLVNSGMPLGAVGGALLLSPANEYLGRKNAIILSILLYTIGAALEASATSFGMMVAGRVILGSGVGLEGGTLPIYVAESVERRLRASLVSLYQFNIALGEVLGYAVGAIFQNVDGNWRYILGSSLVFSTIMFCGILFMPESPRYLMHKGNTLESYKTWKRIRGISTPESREEFYVMTATVRQEEVEVTEGAKNTRFPWMDFFTVPRARRALVYANIMILLGQLTGVNAILYFLSVLMNQIGFDDHQSNYMALVGGGALLIGTIPAIFGMEKFGRRFWAIMMLPGFFVGLVLVGISYQLNLETNQAGVLGLYLTGIVLYMGFFGSYATLTWVIPAEVYPTYLRSYGMTTSDALLFLSSFIVTYNFTGMQNAMGKTGLTLGFYGGIAVIGEAYQLLFMPETKDRTLEEIDLVFSRPTKEIVKDNIAGIKENMGHIANGRFKQLFEGQKVQSRDAGEYGVDKA